MRRRVVITGMGLINPLGHDVETVWGALKESKSGVGMTQLFDASRFPTQISAEVRDWDISSVVDDADLADDAEGQQQDDEPHQRRGS